MKPYKGICRECNREKWISNARNLCDDCVYMKNHEGKTKFEVAKDKQLVSPKKKMLRKKDPLKPTTPYEGNQRQKTKEKRKEVLRKDRETYYQVFLSKPHACEECGTQLPEEFEDENGDIVDIFRFSHIISKGSEPRLRHNSENFNLLCFSCHSNWETGNRINMKIYENNQIIIQKLRENFLFRK